MPEPLDYEREQPLSEREPPDWWILYKVVVPIALLIFACFVASALRMFWSN